MAVSAACSPITTRARAAWNTLRSPITVCVYYEAMGIRVECYAGYRGEQEPRAFHLGERRIEVKAILDRWLAPDHRYFKVQGDDGNTYILRHDEASGEWEMTMYSARGL